MGQSVNQLLCLILCSWAFFTHADTVYNSAAHARPSEIDQRSLLTALSKQSGRTEGRTNTPDPDVTLKRVASAARGSGSRLLLASHQTANVWESKASAAEVFAPLSILQDATLNGDELANEYEELSTPVRQPQSISEDEPESARTQSQFTKVWAGLFGSYAGPEAADSAEFGGAKQGFTDEDAAPPASDSDKPLVKACMQEIDKYCKEVTNGDVYTVRCLEDSLTQRKEFSQACTKEIERFHITTAQDLRLNYRLGQDCASSIDKLCSNVCHAAGSATCGSRLLLCLVQKLDDIQSDLCATEVLHHAEMTVSDIRNGEQTWQACRSDVDLHCGDIKPGEGRLHDCLQRVRDQLSPGCREEEDLISIMQASNIDLKPKLEKACRRERDHFCTTVRAGKSAVFRCLTAHAADVHFGQECREQVVKQHSKRMKDWRMDYNLHLHCNHDVDQVCSTARASDEEHPRGAVVACLVTAGWLYQLSEQCHQEVARSVSIAMKFYKKDRPVTDACDDAVDALCINGDDASKLPAGEVLQCLHAHSTQSKGNATITSACKAVLSQASLHEASRQAWSTSFLKQSIPSWLIGLALLLLLLSLAAIFLCQRRRRRKQSRDL